MLTTSDVARLLKVHPSTTKRWCDEGALPYQRTSGGHRRIQLTDALNLAADRNISTWLDRFRDSADQVWQLVRRAERGDFTLFQSVALDQFLCERPHDIYALTSLLLGHPSIDPLKALDLGVKELMEEVGQRWASGQLGVADERFVSESVSEAMITACHQHTRSGDGQPSAVVASSEPGKHDLGSLCVRFSLMRRRWSTFYLGACVPVPEIAALQHTRECALVCVSFSRPARGSDVQRAVRTLAASYDPAVPYALAVGGEPVADLRLTGLPNPFLRTGAFDTVVEFERWLKEDGS